MKTPIITVHDLSHTFGEGLLQKEALHNVSIVFYPGEIVIITGPSGSGKTTFLTLVGALRSVKSGDVQVNGHGLRNLSGGELMRIRRLMGFIFQTHNLIDALTACENVQMALIGETGLTPESARAMALDSLAEVGLLEYAYKKPRQLSGGQQQRVAIARALVRKPKIILADEPTAALDKTTGREIVDLLHRLAKRTGSTILLVTHDNRILDVADRIVHIEDGRLEETTITIERILGRIRQLIMVLARYPSRWAVAPSGEKPAWDDLHAEFIHTAGPLSRQVTDVAHGHMPAGLAANAQSLQEMLSHGSALEETVSLLGELLCGTALDARIADMLLQSTEFLLITAAETLNDPTPDGVEMLKRLTHDRGEAIGKVRDCYSVSNGSTEGAETLFAVTQVFVRQVYLLHQLIIRYFRIFDFLCCEKDRSRG